MNAQAEFLSPSAAARKLGISAKALRVYEWCGLLQPRRTAAGWKVYGPQEMAQAAQIVALRALGLGLGRVARVLQGKSGELAAALAEHEAVLAERIGHIASITAKVRSVREGLSRPAGARVAGFADLLAPVAEPAVTFDLPWPWGGERFELDQIRPLTYLTGPLGCGKTRLALHLAEAIPGAAFLDLDRATDGAAAARARLKADPALADRVGRVLARLARDGATASPDLVALLASLEAEGPAVHVVDMVEQGLDGSTQGALISYLRRRGPGARPLFLMTRSNVILDMAVVGPDETIIYCPANHSPPLRVAPCVGAPGYETVASCLASPDVRARTEEMRAVRTPGR